MMKDEIEKGDESDGSVSVNSGDEALFEILGINELKFDNDDDESDVASEDGNEEAVFSLLEPPSFCHRPQTPHEPLLMVTCPLLTQAQCKHIISLGYRASNNNGISYGPTYITEAPTRQGQTKVELQSPNKHKVCIFKNPIVLKWIQSVFHQQIHDPIKQWCANNSIPTNYKVNPRLRLLRYDAKHDDIFLPHYDATTFDDHAWESKITILLYLNTGNGIHFDGGNTLFLNSLHPHQNIAIKPQRGRFVIFNHDLYHASEQLTFNQNIILPNNDHEDTTDSIIGGTKFVLRSDLMFQKDQQKSNMSLSRSSIQMPAVQQTDKSVRDVLATWNCDSVELADVLEKLDMMNLSIRTFFVPGKLALQQMLTDLDVPDSISKLFLQHCETFL